MILAWQNGSTRNFSKAQSGCIGTEITNGNCGLGPECYNCFFTILKEAI